MEINSHLSTDHERQRIIMAGYVSNINEMNLAKYADFMHGVRCAFSFIGYKKAIHIPRTFTPAEVYQRAVFDMIMDNNINLHDYIAQRYDIRFKDHQLDKRGRLVSVVAESDHNSSSESRQKKE